MCENDSGFTFVPTSWWGPRAKGSERPPTNPKSHVLFHVRRLRCMHQSGASSARMHNYFLYHWSKGGRTAPFVHINQGKKFISSTRRLSYVRHLDGHAGSRVCRPDQPMNHQKHRKSG